jgi:hypothetical protein
MTTLTPSYHAEQYGPDVSSFFLFPVAERERECVCGY